MSDFSQVKLNKDNYTLSIGYYEIDLEKCTDCAELLDWIFQIQGKAWCTPQVMGTLIAALDEILEPQHYFCSFGMARPKIDIKPLVKRCKTVMWTTGIERSDGSWKSASVAEMLAEDDPTNAAD